MKTKAILMGYFKGVTDVASQGDAREESFYIAMRNTMEEIRRRKNDYG